MKRAVVICATELKLIARNRSTAALAIGMPLAIGIYLAFAQPEFGMEPGAVWPGLVTLQIIAMLGFTVYISTTSTFAARRQDLSLKRLRSGESSDGSIVSGIALPTVLLAVLQVAIVLAFMGVAGAPPPEAPGLVAIAVLGGAAMCSAAGMLTSCITRSGEHAQFTTAPFFFALLAGGVVVMQEAGEASLLQRLIPGGAVSELVRLAWQADTMWLEAALPAIGILAVWTVLPAVAAKRLFRWAPRA